MSEQQYARKALEEVIRLADEKILATEEMVLKKDEDFSEFARSCDDTIKDLDQYFMSIMRQLEKWKHVFIQVTFIFPHISTMLRNCKPVPHLPVQSFTTALHKSMNWSGVYENCEKRLLIF